MRISKIIITGSLLVMLSGCSAHQSQMDQAHIDLPDKFVEKAAYSEPSDPGSPYWLIFEDSVLNRLVEEGLNRNFDLQMGQARIVQLESVMLQSSSLLLPVINLKGSAGEEQQLTAAGESHGNSARLSLAAGYEIDLWKKYSNRTDGDFLALQASKEDQKTLALTVAAQTVDLYFTIIEQQAQLDLIDRIIELYEDNLKLIENRYREGLAPSLDVYLARQNIQAVRSRRPLYEKNIALSTHALSVLIGRFPELEINGLAKTLPILPFDCSVSIPSALLKNRPDVQASLLRLESQDKKVAAAAADRFPSISITAGLGTGRIDFARVVSGSFWNILIDLAAPLFDGGRRQAEVERNKAVFSELLAMYHKTVLRAFQEVEDSLIKTATTGDWIAILTQRLEVAEATLRVANDNYFLGLTEYLNVLSAQAAYFEAQSQLLSARRQLISDWIGLRRALGPDGVELQNQNETGDETDLSGSRVGKQDVSQQTTARESL